MVIKIVLGDVWLAVRLNDTTAVRKWLYVFNENRLLSKFYAHVQATGKYSVKKGKENSEENKRELEIQLHKHVHEVNKATKGFKFPYNAKKDMSWKETQDIHRAFTTSQITGHSFYKPNLSTLQLNEFKFVETHKFHKAVTAVTPKQYDIIDEEAYIYHAEGINNTIHQYEKYLTSRTSDILYKKFPEQYWIFNQWQSKAAAKFITLTLDEIKDSFNHTNTEGYSDVFMHSSIFGKPYLDTYLEDERAMELDVKNIENISGEFSIVTGGHEDDVYNLHNNSPYSKWLEKFNLPQYITHPIPLGKIEEVSDNFSGFCPNYIPGEKIEHDIRVYYSKRELDRSEAIMKKGSNAGNVKI